MTQHDIPTILIVDDEQSLRDVIIKKVEESGFNHMSAKNINEAKNILSDEGNRKSIDAVWLDHYLPGGKGTDLVHFIKSDEGISDLPIFVVSNTANGEDVYNYIQLGITDYYVKSETKMATILQDIRGYLKEN